MTNYGFDTEPWVGKLNRLLNGEPEPEPEGSAEEGDQRPRMPEIPVDYAAAEPPPPPHVVDAPDSLARSFMEKIRGY